MFKLADFVKETSTTTGTGTYSLAGAETGFRTFVAGVGDGNVCYYCAEDGTDWEIGVGTVTDATPDTLSRDTILASSNAGAAVNWAAGTRNVFVSRAATSLRRFRYQSGQRYSAVAHHGSSVSAAANMLFVYGVFIGEPVTIDQITVRSNNSTAGRTLRVGIYYDNGSGYPGALLLDCGSIDCSTTGYKTASISNTVLLPGLHWLATGGVEGLAFNMYSASAWYGAEQFKPLYSDMTTYVWPGAYYDTGAGISTMPDPFPGTGWSASLTNAAAVPFVMFRVV